MKIIKEVRAPVRIDFGGGTTDIFPFTFMYGGVVLSAAINRYVTGKIIKTARYYLQSRNLLDKCEIRFDVIGVQGDKLKHIEDAFRV